MLKNDRGKFWEGRKYRFMSDYEGTKCHSLALQYVLSNPHVNCAIIGTTNPQHLKMSLAASLNEIPRAVKQKIQEV